MTNKHYRQKQTHIKSITVVSTDNRNWELLREEGVDQLHNRQLRSFAAVAFQ